MMTRGLFPLLAVFLVSAAVEANKDPKELGSSRSNEEYVAFRNRIKYPREGSCLRLKRSGFPNRLKMNLRKSFNRKLNYTVAYMKGKFIVTQEITNESYVQIDVVHCDNLFEDITELKRPRNVYDNGCEISERGGTYPATDFLMTYDNFLKFRVTKLPVPVGTYDMQRVFNFEEFEGQPAGTNFMVIVIYNGNDQPIFCHEIRVEIEEE